MRVTKENAPLILEWCRQVKIKDIGIRWWFCAKAVVASTVVINWLERGQRKIADAQATELERRRYHKEIDKAVSFGS